MSEAVIRWIGGPVLHARTQGDFRVGEAIEVGADRRPGEVIRLNGDELVGQVYEDTTGLRPGDPVRGTGGALVGASWPRPAWRYLRRPAAAARCGGAAQQCANRVPSAGEGRRQGRARAADR